MFIRCTTTKTGSSGETYKSFRLVESERVNGKVKQRTLINRGLFFDVPQAHWQSLSSRIHQLLAGQSSLLNIDLDTDLEPMAQRYTAQIIASRSTVIDKDTQYEAVDIASVALVRPWRIGIEHLALYAVKQLTLDDKLKTLGFNQHQLAAALGNIIGRMAAPASELGTHGWLQATSGLGDLIDYDFEGMNLDRL
ncbi:MAG: hypothetical protein ACI8TV_001112 [Porticoccaceae bacterium]|jgi:hypothetical protein